MAYQLPRPHCHDREFYEWCLDNLTSLRDRDIFFQVVPFPDTKDPYEDLRFKNSTELLRYDRQRQRLSIFNDRIAYIDGRAHMGLDLVIILRQGAVVEDARDAILYKMVWDIDPVPV